MATKKDEKNKQEAPITDGEQKIEHPNRDQYAAMFAEDNPDINFEDKEARYGRLREERENYRTLRASGQKLTEALSLDGNRWMGAMFQDLAKNPEKNPLVWFAENGIDLRSALDDPKVMEEVSNAFDGWKKKQADGEASEKAQYKAIDASLDALSAVQQEYGLTDEQYDRMWNHFWDEVFLPAFNGEVKKDTWVSLLHAMNYDSDMANAREEAAMQARNEKHANKLKTFDERQVPPSFSQGNGQQVSPRRKKEGSLMDFVKRYS